MIAVERGDERRQRPDRGQVAPFDVVIRQPQRLGQPRDLEVNVTFRSIEAPLVEGAVDLTPDRSHAGVARLGDLLGRETGGERFEITLAQAAALARRACVAARALARLEEDGASSVMAAISDKDKL